ncbi:hypothetical protein WJX84_001683 [Apatococcus fuscideae]|uniref:MSP domain-containing protein n=1 Tax=Apatococcus fuscideae TaxID=2026836 RepID=A0AAW1T4P6_9CHLO
MGAFPDGLHLEPEELVFSNVRLGQAYCHTIKITNTLEASVEATIRPGSPERYSVSPSNITLKPGEATSVDDEAMMDQLYLLLESQKAAMRDQDEMIMSLRRQMLSEQEKAGLRRHGSPRPNSIRGSTEATVACLDSELQHQQASRITTMMAFTRASIGNIIPAGIGTFDHAWGRVPQSHALVEAAVAQEKALQETRNLRVLDLLRSKDEALQASEDRCTELAAEKAQLMLQLGDTANQLQARENRLAEVLEGRAKLRRQLDQSHADFTAMQASLKAELVAVQASTPELARNLHPLAPTRDIWHCSPLIKDPTFAPQEANDKLEHALLDANRMRAMLATRPLIPTTGEAEKRAAHLQSSLSIAQADQSTWQKERQAMQKARDTSRLTSERLNARISELALSVNSLQAELSASSKAHGQATERHHQLQRNVTAALEQHQDLEGLQTALRQATAPSPSTASIPRSRGLPEAAPKQLAEQAISKPGEEGLHFEVFKAEAEAEKARLRLEIQHCRDDAAAELQALQELNTSLSGRSNLHQELAHLGARLTTANKKVSSLQLDLRATQTSLHAKASQLDELTEKTATHKSVADANGQGIPDQERVHILIETVETLQAGSAGEKEQRIVALTAQMSAARLRETMLERRNAEVVADAASLTGTVQDQASQLGLLSLKVQQADSSRGEAESAAGGAHDRAHACRTELHTVTVALHKASSAADEAQKRATRLQAELSGMREAMAAASTHHHQQLSRERREASAALRAARAAAADNTDKDDLSPGALAEGIDGIISALQRLGGASHANKEAQPGLLPGSSQEDLPQRVLAKLKTLLIVSNASCNQAAADARIARLEAGSLEQKLRWAEKMLDSKVADAQRATAERDDLVTFHEQSQVMSLSRECMRHQEVRISALTQQLDLTHQELATCQASQRSLQDEARRQRNTLETKDARLAAAASQIQSMEAALSAALQEATGTPNATSAASREEATAQRDAGLQAWFEAEAGRLLLSDDSAATIMALTREVCGLKLAQSQLAANEGAARTRLAAAQKSESQLQKQLEAVTARCSYLEEQAEAGQTDQLGLARLRQDLAGKAAEIHALQTEQLTLRQQLVDRDAAMKQAQSIQAGAASALKHERVQFERQLEESRHQLAADFGQERRALLDELRDARAAAEEQRAVLATLTEDGALALAARPEPEAHEQVVTERDEALRAVEEWEARCQQLEAEAEVLQAETMLTSLQKACDQGRHAGVGASRRTDKGQPEAFSTVMLSRQLVQAKLSDADAHRKLRVSARAEVVLRQRLAERDARIDELKAIIARCKPAGLSRPTARQTWSISPLQPAPMMLPAPASASLVAGNGSSSRQSPIEPSSQPHSGTDPSPAQPLLVHNSSASLAGECADLRIELARRDAEIESLQGALAAAAASQQDSLAPYLLTRDDASAEQEMLTRDLRRQLRALQDACRDANTAARAALGLGPMEAASDPTLCEEQPFMQAHCDQLGSLVDLMTSKMKEKDAQIRRMKVSAKAADARAVSERAEAAASPLDAAQRSVIGHLGLKVSSMNLQVASLKEERDLAQARLRALRASLGARAMPGAADPPVRLTSEDTSPLVPQAATAQQDGTLHKFSQRKETATELEGLCQLLEHHLDAMEAAQKPLQSLDQGSEASDQGHGQDDRDEGSKLPASALPRIIAAACSSVIEIGSMRATLQVLASALSSALALPSTPGALQCVEETSADHSPRTRHQVCNAAVQTSPSTTPATFDDWAGFPSPHPSRSDHSPHDARNAPGASRPHANSASQTDHAASTRHGSASPTRPISPTRTSAAESAWKERQQALQQAAAEQTSRAERRLVLPDAPPPQTQELTTAIRDAAAAAMRATEAEARVDVLQRQADTLRAQSMAVQASLRERVESLTANLAQEKNERGKIVTSLRETIHGLRRAGDVEGRLKTELIQQHELLAAARAAQEQAESKAVHRKTELRAARGKLDGLQQQLSKQGAEAELADHIASLRLSGVQQELKSLGGRLAAADALRIQLEASLQSRISHVMEKIEQDTTMPLALEEHIQQFQKMAEAWDHKLQQAEEQRQVADRERSSNKASRHAVKEQQLEDQTLTEKHASQLHEVEAHMDAERKALRQAASAAAATAAASAEERAKKASQCRMRESEHRALQDITNAQAAQQQLVSEVDDLRTQFKAYQQVKAKEVAALEARLRQCLMHPQDADRASKYATPRKLQRGPGATFDGRQDSSWALLAGLPRGKADTDNLNAACEVASAMESESILAALREANFERLERESAEAAAVAAHEASEKLRAKLKATQKDVATLREAAAVAAAEAKQRPSAEALLKAQEQAHSAQQDLKATKAESSRRLKALQDLQRCCDDTCLPIPASAMAAERAAREAAEGKASSAQAALTRKTQLIADLRKRVTDLEESVVRSSIRDSPGGPSVGSEARIKAQQAALQRRDEMLHELRNRLDQAGRDIAAKRESEEVQTAAARKFKADLARRDTQLKDALVSLDQVQEEAAAAAAAADAEHKQCSQKIQSADAACGSVQRWARRILETLHEVARLVLHSSNAMWQTADSLAASSCLQRESWARSSTETIARIVDLDLNELADMLGPESQAVSAQSRIVMQRIERLLQELSNGLEGLEKGTGQREHWQPAEHLLAGLTQELEQAVHQAKTSLTRAANKRNESNSLSQQDQNLLESLEYRAQKDISSTDAMQQLETELWRASHGLEADA